MSFAYAYNSANQRTRVDLADGSYLIYQYDNLGQVKSGKRYWADGTVVAEQQFEYGFDDIGNRKTAMSGGSQFGTSLRTNTYGANLLNQYTSRSVLGYVEVQGSSHSNATVTVNNESTYRKGSYYRKELSANNTSAAIWLGITNVAVLNGAGTNGTDIVSTKTGNLLIPKTPEAFSYDTDGNTVQDGRWNYSWDGENRLTRLESLTNAPDASRRRLDFAYDHHFRRVQKVVSAWGGSAYTTQSTNRFLYDGWNLVAMLNGSGTLLQSFRWGTDLSGSLQGAGGVGGLLSMTVHQRTNTGTYFYCYDGNGNVSALVSAADGTVVARYEYGPFGELLRATGPIAQLNPFRFSTKFYDDESGFLYYGYRYYDPSTGRWPNRDPIGELGGRNLYVIVWNSPVNLFDYLGLAGKKCTEAMGKNGQPRIVFDPSPQKGGGWKVTIDFELGGSAQAQAVEKIEFKWKASVAVLCKCDPCYEIRHGTRVHTDSEIGNWLVYAPGSLPASPFPVAANLGAIVSGIIADKILDGSVGGSFIPADADQSTGIMNALKALLSRRPTKPTDGSWKDGKSPCD